MRLMSFTSYDGTVTKSMEKLDLWLKTSSVRSTISGMETRTWSEDDRENYKIVRLGTIPKIQPEPEGSTNGQSLGNRDVNSSAARITKLIADIEDRHNGPVMQCTTS
ncbi:hypothetical protein Tco_0240869 [Tanacetum coccineum]